MVCFRRNIDTPWGLALERVRTKSLYRLHKDHVIARRNYMHLLNATLGPSIAVLDRVLSAQGVSWSQWATAYETAKQDIARERVVTVTTWVSPHPDPCE